MFNISIKWFSVYNVRELFFEHDLQDGSVSFDHSSLCGLSTLIEIIHELRNLQVRWRGITVEGGQ